MRLILENPHDIPADHSKNPVPETNISRPGPVQPGQRIQILDVIRGVAIFGILLINIQFYGRPIITIFDFHEAGQSGLDYLLKILTLFFVSEKFFPILGILFGAGTGIIFSRMVKREGNFYFIYTRRLIGLFIIGILHAILLYAGDFMGNYAILGFILMICVKFRPKLLLILSIVVLLIPVFMEVRDILFPSKEMPVHQSEQLSENPEMGYQMFIDSYVQASVNAYGRETFAELFKFRLTEVRIQYSGLPFVGYKMLSMFLFGLWCWKKRIDRKFSENRGLLKRTMWISLIVGVTGCGFSLLVNIVPLQVSRLGYLFSFLGQQVGAPAISVFYITLIFLAFKTDAGRKLLGIFSPVGRMAMSNYVFQSLISTTIFYSYGLGLFYRTSYSENILLAFGIFVIQVILSRIWLSRFKFGPLEWLLRSFAYLRR